MINLKLTDFKKNSQFYKTLKIAATVKRSTSPVYQAGVYRITIRGGLIIEKTLLFPIQESRGLFFDKNNYCYSSYDTVYIKGQTSNSIHSDSFGYIHNLQLKDDMLLICSTQNDSLFIYDIKTSEKIWSWSAFSNGYSQLVNMSKDVILKNTDEYDKISKANKRCYLLTDEIRSSDKYRKGLFINSAYFNDSYVWFTSLNTGYVYRINIVSKLLERYHREYVSPHGIFYVDNKHFLVTSSEENKIFYNRDGIDYEIQITNKSQTQKFGITKWLQTSRVFDNLIVAIDSMTNEIIVLDFDNRYFDKVSFDEEWRMHDIFLLNSSHVNF